MLLAALVSATVPLVNVHPLPGLYHPEICSVEGPFRIGIHCHDEDNDDLPFHTLRLVLCSL
jgi:hypothetical protein